MSHKTAITVEARLIQALNSLPNKPPDSAKSHVKKRYSEQVSEAVAYAFAEELRERGLEETRPTRSGKSRGSGAERRIGGGIGAKKVDITWATEESGLLFAASVKTINFKDLRTDNFQKNLTNRRGDMLFEAVTLHRRFPYAVLAGFFLFDRGAAEDGTDRRQSTFLNAHDRFRLFTGRDDPAGRDEQYERLFVGLLDANPRQSTVELYLAGKPKETLSLRGIFEDLMDLIAERNPDFYRATQGRLFKA